MRNEMDIVVAGFLRRRTAQKVGKLQQAAREGGAGCRSVLPIIGVVRKGFIDPSDGQENNTTFTPGPPAS